MNLLGHYNYWVVIVLMMIGFYILITEGNLIKKVVGLNVFQTSVFIFYISTGAIIGGTAPILYGEVAHDAGGHVEEGDHAAEEDDHAEDDAAVAAQEEDHDEPAEGGHELEYPKDVDYSNPLPHVLILTAIVVGIATTAVALGLVVRIHEAYGTIEEDEIHDQEMASAS